MSTLSRRNSLFCRKCPKLSISTMMIFKAKHRLDFYTFSGFVFVTYLFWEFPWKPISIIWTKHSIFKNNNKSNRSNERNFFFSFFFTVFHVEIAKHPLSSFLQFNCSLNYLGKSLQQTRKLADWEKIFERSIKINQFYFRNQYVRILSQIFVYLSVYL